MSVTPQQDQLASLVVEFAARLAPVRPRGASVEQEFVRDLGYGSLAMVELEFALEELFGLEPITPEQVADIRSVGDLVGFIRDQLADGASALPEARTVELMRAQHPFPV